MDHAESCDYIEAFREIVTYILQCTANWTHRKEAKSGEMRRIPTADGHIREIRDPRCPLQSLIFRFHSWFLI